MTTFEIHGLFVGIPLLLFVVLMAWTFRHKGPHPATYRMSEPWTHEPILWSAVDERIGGQHGHGSHELTVGGGASGKW